MADFTRKLRARRKPTLLEESLLNDEERAVLYELDQSFLQDDISGEQQRAPSRCSSLRHVCWLFISDKGVISLLCTLFILSIGVVLIVLSRQLSWPSRVEELSRYIVSAGVFGLAGGGTNWIAVIMLIYKIPCFVGSGVFYRQHRQIRNILKQITIQMLFDSKHLETYLERKIAQFSSNVQVVENITQALKSPEGEKIIREELDLLYRQPEAHYLQVLGLNKEKLQPLIKPSVLSLCAETAPLVLGAVSDRKASEALSIPLFRKELQQFVNWRLEELTEKRIGSLMRKLIYKQLGWLVVWGCVFGLLAGIVVQGLKLSLNFNFSSIGN